jgi:hypothetical protein
MGFDQLFGQNGRDRGRHGFCLSCHKEAGAGLEIVAALTIGRLES